MMFGRFMGISSSRSPRLWHVILLMGAVCVILLEYHLSLDRGQCLTTTKTASSLSNPSSTSSQPSAAAAAAAASEQERVQQQQPTPPQRPPPPAVSIEQLSAVVKRPVGSKYNGTCLQPLQEPVFEWQKRAPLAILVGMQKGGTKAFHAYLGEHPDIADNHRKNGETHFFDIDLTTEHNFDPYVVYREIIRSPAGIPAAMNQHLYGEMFWKHRDSIVEHPDKFAFDDSPRYLFLSDRVPDAIVCVAPWAKLIALLRQPIDRVVSAYNMLYRRTTYDLSWDMFIQSDLDLLRQTGVVQNWTEVDFDSWAGSEEEAAAWERYLEHFVRIDQELPLGRGLYAIMLEHYFAAMDRVGKPRSDLMVIRSEDMRNNIQGVYDSVLEFLNLRPHKLENNQVTHTTPASGNPLPDHWRTVMEEFFEPYNKRLYKLLDWDPAVWENYPIASAAAPAAQGSSSSLSSVAAASVAASVDSTADDHHEEGQQ